MPRLSGTTHVLALVIAGGRLSAQGVAKPTVEVLAGCYALTLGPWEHQYAGGAASWQNIPTTFRLDTMQGAVALAGTGWRQLTPVPSHFAGRDRLASGWRLSTSDSVGLFWSNGFVGTSVALAVHGDTLVGVARARTDAIDSTPDPTAPARAVRIACPPGLH